MRPDVDVEAVPPALPPLPAEGPGAGLSIGLDELVGHWPWLDTGVAGPPAPRPATFDCDLLIVGSGYGAAMAAWQLAGWRPAGSDRPLSILILERGLEHPAGSFPSSGSELPGHLRGSLPGQAVPKGRRTGLFDLRLGADVSALVANGVGGGSLINAGVMLAPRPAVLQSAAWPAALRQPGAPATACHKP